LRESTQETRDKKEYRERENDTRHERTEQERQDTRENTEREKERERESERGRRHRHNMWDIYIDVHINALCSPMPHRVTKLNSKPHRVTKFNPMGRPNSIFRRSFFVQMSVNFGVYGLQSLLRVSECSPFFSISTVASKDFLMKLSIL
jgi:hypothetical protein